MHLDQEHIERLLHGELPPVAREELREHLAGCGLCRERLNGAERDETEIFALFRHMDYPPPIVSAEAVAARARSSGLVWRRWAAGVVLFVGLAGAAYATPGSPLREWVNSAAAWIAGLDRQAPPAPRVPAPDSGVAGVAAPPGRSFIIAFESPEAGGRVRVALTEGDEVTVRAPSGAAGFTSAADRLLIDSGNTGATYQIEIPRAAPRVEIRVGGNRIFLKEGSRVLAESLAENGDLYLLPLSRYSR
jgi:Putative zinc-finger